MQLARSYGLHLLPEGGQNAPLHDNLTSVLKQAPAPPELRSSAPEPRGEL